MMVLVLVVLAACSGKNTDSTNSDGEKLHVLQAELSVPESADVNEPVQLQGTVSYGDEAVKDAEVEFEIWQDGDKDNTSEKVEATNHKDGTYSIETTFDKDGMFTVQIHVTAKDQHTMPQQNIKIGTGASAAQPHDKDSEQEHDHHTEGFAMHFMEPEQVTAGDEVDLITHIELDDNPLENAIVTYEIWQDNADDNDRDWVNTEATNIAGEFSGKYTFKKAALYHIKIHVKGDNELHEHEVRNVKVN